jgi:hypothetical protein
MKNIAKEIYQINAVQSIEFERETIFDKPHLRVTASKASAKKGDIELIFKILNNQNYYHWTFNFIS